MCAPTSYLPVVQITLPSVEYSRQCLSPSAKKSGHSHISPLSHGLTSCFPLGLPEARGCRYSQWRKSCERYSSTHPPLPRSPEATPIYQPSLSCHGHGSRKPVTAIPGGGVAMTGVSSFFQRSR